MQRSSAARSVQSARARRGATQLPVPDPRCSCSMHTATDLQHAHRHPERALLLLATTLALLPEGEEEGSLARWLGLAATITAFVFFS